MDKVTKFFDNLPKFIKVGLWVGISAAVTYIGSEILNRPDLAQYYGVVNVVLFSVNELDKKVRRNGKK